MKPDDIAQWAWDEADETTYNIETDRHGSIEYTEARVSIARLVMKARSQAFEEIESLLTEFVWDEHALAQATEAGKALHNQAVEISQAIRQHSQKGGEK